MKYKVVLLERAKDFLESLNTKMRAKSYRTIQLLESFGALLPMPHARKIVGSEKLFELRVQQGSNIVRFFYFLAEETVFVVTSGYVKKTQKTDSVEIQRAIRLMTGYLEDRDEQS